MTASNNLHFTCLGVDCPERTGGECGAGNKIEIEVEIDNVVHDLEALDFNSIEARDMIRQALQTAEARGREQALTCQSCKSVNKRTVVCEMCVPNPSFSQAEVDRICSLKAKQDETPSLK
jgi:hypothetical protein